MPRLEILKFLLLQKFPPMSTDIVRNADQYHLSKVIVNQNLILPSLCTRTVFQETSVLPSRDLLGSLSPSLWKEH